MKKITFLLIALMVFTFGQSQNLALNGTASASSELQPANNAKDGNAGTRWESAHEPSGDITIDLGISYDIGKIILNWEGAYADEYEILISNDPTFATSTNIYSTTTGNGGIDELFVSGTARYVRMNGIHRFLNAYGYSLWEFEIYEATDPAIDATLSDLTIDGITVSGFGPSTLDYNIELPIGTTVVPTVVATTSQTTASAVVMDTPSVPGITTILVTAQNGTDTNTYTITFTVDITPVQQTFDLTFESGTVGSIASNWNVFENGPNLPLEVVTNPNATGANTSATVAKVTTLAIGAPYAGCETQHGTVWEWVLDGSTTTITIDVYKTVISDVGIKMVNSTSGTIFQLLQPNTVINAWETLTYNITSAVASGDNHNVDQIVVFPDWQNRSTDNISYFDNVSWEGLKLADAPPSLSTTDFEIIELKIYPNPTQNVWNVKSTNTKINSVEVIDMIGKHVFSVYPNSNEVQIDASTLNVGLYYARIKSDSGIKTVKLIKK